MRETAHTAGRTILAGAVLGILLACTPTSAFAYVDPGTGSFVYQAFYAGLLTGAFYLRKLVRKLRGKAGDSNN